MANKFPTTGSVISTMSTDWQKEMHNKWHNYYTHCYDLQTNKQINTPSFTDIGQANEFNTYVRLMQSGGIKCPCCGK